MKCAYLMPGMKFISFVVIAMESIFLYGNGQESVPTKEEFDFKTWSALVGNISDSWKDKPSEYALVIKREVDLVVKMDDHHEKLKRIRLLITNVVNKVSIADSASLVRQQSDLLLYCLNAKECVSDVDSWKNIARAIGYFRVRMVPNYRKKSVLNPGAPGMTEAELKKLRDLNDVNIELDRLQRDLRESSSTWTAMLISMMKANSKRFSRDAFTGIVGEVVVLAHFTDGEKGELLHIADVWGQEELIGTWKACHLSSCLLRPSPDITWKEICFTTNGLVSIVLSDGEGNSVRKLAGTYAFLNKAKAGYANKREIRIWLKGAKDASTVVLHNVRIGEFSCFPRGRHVLWFRDDNGMDCVYEPLLAEMVNANRCVEVNGLIKEDHVGSTVSKDKRKGVRFSRKLCEDLLSAAPDVYKQHKAILRIMNEGDSSCVSTLIPYTMPDKESILREDAVRALGAVGSPAAVSRLVQMLKEPVVSQQYVEEEDAAILRRAVVDALKSTGDLSALPVLESVASSRNEYQSVREMAQIAAEALSKEEK